MVFEYISPARGAHAPGIRSGLESDLFPVQVLGVGVFLKIFFVNRENGPNHGGIVLKADLGDEIGNDVEKSVGVNDGKSGSGRSSVRHVLVSSFGEVLHHVGQKLKLIYEMGKLGGMNLGEFGLKKGEAMKKVVHDPWGDSGSPPLGEVRNFCHEYKL
jgi:hypothetical protein